MQKTAILKKAADSASLEARIRENKSGQEIDFVKWVFDSVGFASGDKVLELCCGTGAQTLPILKMVGKTGEVTAVDIAPDSLSRLSSGLSKDEASRCRLIKSDIDSLNRVLGGEKYSGYFDAVFCSYGLYYSKNPEQVLEYSRKLLKDDGQIIVVGPYGENNRQIFRLVESSGAKINDYVKFTCSDFMIKTVLPWAALRFEHIEVFTAVNKVHWEYPEKVVEYWKNSTFFDPSRLDSVKKNIERHFEKNREFINEKWIMNARFSHAR